MKPNWPDALAFAPSGDVWLLRITPTTIELSGFNIGWIIIGETRAEDGSDLGRFLRLVYTRLNLTDQELGALTRLLVQNECTIAWRS